MLTPGVGLEPQGVAWRHHGALSVVSTAGGPWLGRLSDRHGRKPVLTLCLVGGAGGYVLMALGIAWRSPPLLLLSRVVEGFFNGDIAIVQAMAADMSTARTKARNRPHQHRYEPGLGGGPHDRRLCGRGLRGLQPGGLAGGGDDGDQPAAGALAAAQSSPVPATRDEVPLSTRQLLLQPRLLPYFAPDPGKLRGRCSSLHLLQCLAGGRLAWDRCNWPRPPCW